jgi:hypothetical protein
VDVTVQDDVHAGVVQELPERLELIEEDAVRPGLVAEQWMVHERERARRRVQREVLLRPFLHRAAGRPHPSGIARFFVIGVCCPRSGFHVESLQIWEFSAIRCHEPRSNE